MTRPRALLSRRGFLSSSACLLATPALAATGSGLRFDNVYGETQLPAPAKRVVSLGYNTHDALLALGVVPVGIRYWYGDYPYGVWPWAQDLLGSAQPTVMTGEVSIETVASLTPDLIVASGSGISQDEYALLSQIAPVLMQDPAYSTYGSPWDVELQRIARATGTEDRAKQLLAQVRERFTTFREAHPDWQGQSAVCAWHDGGQTGAFMGGDTRAQFLAELGFRPPERLQQMQVIDGFYTALSPEDLSPIDADLLIWISSDERASDIASLAMRRTLSAYAEGREVFCNELLAGALSFGSVLSMPFALDRLGPEFAAALDGDPTTAVPTAQAAGLLP
ncbi:iron-siderophore ABC transporter substrate-binding protein [Salipiger sp. PrR002]|uniref:iron-siderophore ABC transporter substrate-binding protein n=1 Tax=Salipiger sp. PrR002 TaxID=2706489 RepID=UPI0013B76901|nr:iron-siderophore ABC transporter substrate-binding protein [Salipiger sp. PrR002]NDW01126.1 iron-siderophore ABC transporter substrate-binding protein [Salipiger sp. PrR002]NDW57929.1 iron-siderophore ABC transporter substrate-binding protein [Salipiger sp. PrR004]